MVTLDVKLQQFTKPGAAEQDGELVAVQGGFQIIQGITALIPAEYSGVFTPALTTEIQLGFLRDGRLRLREPLKVTVTSEEGQVIAEAGEINEFGYGLNLTEAVKDLQHAIGQLYFTLEEDQDILGSDLRSVWEILEAKIQKRDEGSRV